jgi:hypothetical protein
MTRTELLSRLRQLAADYRAAAAEARAEDELREADWYVMDAETVEEAIAVLEGE